MQRIYTTLVCSQKGCPRIKKVQFDPKTMPENTAKIESRCPWHSSAGDFEFELYFDAEGNQLGFDGVEHV